MSSTIKLQTESVLQVPIYNYQQDFLFIVNGEKYMTNKFVADLLSNKISKIHQTDPTSSEYFITTHHKGNFKHILDLLEFNLVNIDESEIEFITEIIDELGTDKIDLNIYTPEITIDNAIKHISKQEKSKIAYTGRILKEIEFLSSHFYELTEIQTQELTKLSPSTVEQIVGSKKIELESEDQLLAFINELYSINEIEYSSFYEYVHFTNVSNSKMFEFISKFDIENLNHGTWKSLCERLLKIPTFSVLDNSKSGENVRYKNAKVKKKSVTNCDDIPFSKSDLKGVFSHFRTYSNIEKEVIVSCLSLNHGSPENLLDIDNTTYSYCTNDRPNSWICFEFKKRKIIPSAYTIKTTYNNEGMDHLKSWVIEGSVDNNNWMKLDEQNNCSLLNGENLCHTFVIENLDDRKEFKYLRIRQTGENWHNRNYLEICSIEFYGKLI